MVNIIKVFILLFIRELGLKFKCDIIIFLLRGCDERDITWYVEMVWRCGNLVVVGVNRYRNIIGSYLLESYKFWFCFLALLLFRVCLVKRVRMCIGIVALWIKEFSMCLYLGDRIFEIEIIMKDLIEVVFFDFLLKRRENVSF